MAELDDLIDVVDELLDPDSGLGRNVTFRTFTKTYDRTTGKTAESSQTDHVAKAVARKTHKFFPEDGASREVWQVLVAAKGLTFTPAPGMRVIAGSETFDATKVDFLYAHATVIGYKVEGDA